MNQLIRRTVPTNCCDGCWLAQIGNGQGDGIRTRTVRVTGGDANYYITTLMKMEPLVGLAPTNTGLRNPPCCC